MKIIIWIIIQKYLKKKNIQMQKVYLLNYIEWKQVKEK